jgi:hypothetical protein
MERALPRGKDVTSQVKECDKIQHMVPPMFELSVLKIIGIGAGLARCGYRRNQLASKWLAILDGKKL